MQEVDSLNPFLTARQHVFEIQSLSAAVTQISDVKLSELIASKKRNLFMSSLQLENSINI